MSGSADADILVAVLAAGAARRFGADKLSRMAAGRPLVDWAVETARATGHATVAIVRDDRGFEPGFAIVNRDADAGMGTSVALAAAEASRRGSRALLVALADMPLVAADTLAALVEAWRADPARPVACRQADGSPGAPAILPADFFPALEALDGDKGAGAILRESDAALIDVPPDELLDVDTAQDLARAEDALYRRLSTDRG